MSEAKEPVPELERRVLALEINKGVADKTEELQNRVRDLEALVKTARYFVAALAGIVSIVGIGVTVYISTLSSKFDAANSQISKTKKFIEEAHHDMQNAQNDVKLAQSDIAASKKEAEKLNSEMTELSGKANENARIAKELKENFSSLVRDASKNVEGYSKEAASESVREEIAKLLLPIPQFQKKVNDDIDSINTRLEDIKGRFAQLLITLSRPDFQQVKSIELRPTDANPWPSFTCDDGTFAIGGGARHDGVIPKEAGLAVSSINIICGRIMNLPRPSN